MSILKSAWSRIARSAAPKQETQTDLGDYEKVAGVYFPFSIASGPKNSADSDKQVITIASGEANVAVPPSLFAMPAAPVASTK